MQTTLLEILNEAKLQGVRLWVENGELKYKAKVFLSNDLKSRISREKSALIALLSQENQQVSIAKNDVVKIAKASSLQKSIWFSSQASENTGHYNIPIVIRYEGVLNAKRFENSLHQIVNENDILRASFGQDDNEILQIINDAVSYTIHYKDVSSLKLTEKMINKIILNCLDHKFILENAPLFSFNYIRLSSHSYILIFNFHHIIFDAGSIANFLSKLSRIYNSVEYDDTNQVNSLTYIDFTIWYEKQLNDKKFVNSDEYWKDALSDELPLLSLPLDYERPRQFTFKGNKITFNVDSGLSQIIKKIISSSKFTPFNFFLTVYALFLRDFTSQRDLIIGIPASLRIRSELQEMLGLFVNSLPIRINLENCEDNTFMLLQESIQAKVLSAISNGMIPFERIVNNLSLSRDLSYNPIFQTMFLYESSQPIDLLEGTGQFLTVPSPFAKFDLTLAVIDEGAQYLLEFEYCCDFFREKTIEQFADGFNKLLNSISKNVSLPIRLHNVITQEQIQSLLQDTNNNNFKYNKAVTILDLFDRYTGIFPESLAVSDEVQQFTYKQLNELSIRYAIELKSAEISEDDVVIVYAARTAQTLACILAVFKLGAIWLPIDPDSPKHRIEFILADSQAKILLYDDSTKVTAQQLSSHVFLKSIASLDTLPSYGNEQLLSYELTGMTPAYIIYTSGSTGNPKGVLIGHDSLSHYIQWSVHAYAWEKGSGAPVHSSLAFDLTITSLFTPLAMGKTVFMLPDHKGFEALIEILQTRQDFSLVKITPAHLKLLQSQLSVKILEKLHCTFVIGGEALFKDDLSYLLEMAPNARFINEYGPTETTIGAMHYEIPKEIKVNSVPIGKPIPNYRIYLLDSQFRPVPKGVLGELFIAGVGLAKAYYNNTKLTNQRFINDPFNPSTNSKMYRTGDLAKINADGNIIYHARTDHQVKLKGYRIELGEIEAILNQYELIIDAVVCVKNISGIKTLVTYLVIKEISRFDLGQLRLFLQERLAYYMIPTKFYQIDKIPITLNGKVNRKQLMNSPYDELIFKKIEESELNTVEMQIRDIWENVLNIDNVSVEDNFFDLGGDSIAAMQVVSSLKKYGYQIGAKQIFKLQTIKAIAEHINLANEKINLEVKIAEGEFALTPIQQWFFDLNMPHPNHYLQTLILQAKSGFAVVQMQEAIILLTEFYDIFKLRFKKIGSSIIQAYDTSNEPIKCITINNEIMKSSEKFKNYISKLYGMIDILNGPLFIALIITSDNINIDKLILISHHLIIDGVSWRVLTSNLEKLIKGKPLDSYINYITWTNYLNQYKENAINHEEILYWSSQCQQRFEFIGSKERLATALESTRIVMDSKVVARLEKIKFPISNIGLSDLLLAAFSHTYYKMTGASSLSLCLESHGREELFDGLDLSNSLGWFTSLYPFNISNALNIETKEDALLALVKKINLARIRVPKQGIGFGLLNRESSIINKMPEICFNYLGSFKYTAESLFEEINIEGMPYPISACNTGPFALTINIWLQQDELFIDTSCIQCYFKDNNIVAFTKCFENSILLLLNECEQYFSNENNLPIRARWINQSFHELENFPATLYSKLFPALPGQKLMYKYYKVSNNSNAYFTQVYWSYLQYKVESHVLKTAWKKIIDEVPSLKIRLHERDGELFQMVLASDDVCIIEQDYAKHEFSECLLKQILAKDKEAKFALQGGSLMRIHLLNFQDRTTIVWSHHHILIDGWSVAIIIEKLNRKILDSKNTKPSSFLLDYEDYFTQRYWSKDLDNIYFWNDLLNNYGGISNLPGAKALQTLWKPVENEDYCRYKLEKTKYAELKHVVNSNRVTLNTVLQFLWAQLLSNTLKVSDISYGIIVSGRDKFKNPQDYCGMFVNILPIRYQFNDPINQNINNYQMMLENAYLHSDIDMIELESSLELKDSKQLINSLFIYENYPRQTQASSINNVVFTQPEFSTITNSPLTIIILPGDELEVVLAYDTDIFESETINQLLDTYLQMINNFSIEKVYKQSKVNSASSLILEFNPGKPDDEVYVLIHPGMGGYEAYAKLIPCLPKRVLVIDSYNISADHYIETIHELADRYILELKEVLNGRPCHLLAWSYGGLIAHEIAQRKCMDITRLILIDSFNLDSIQKRIRKLCQESYLMNFNQFILNNFLNLTKEKLKELSNVELTAQLDFEPSLTDSHSYQVHLIKADQLPKIKISDDHYYEFMRNLVSNKFNGWDRVYPEISVHHVASDHYSLLSNDVGFLIEIICSLNDEIKLERVS